MLGTATSSTPPGRRWRAAWSIAAPGRGQVLERVPEDDRRPAARRARSTSASRTSSRRESRSRPSASRPRARSASSSVPSPAPTSSTGPGGREPVDAARPGGRACGAAARRRPEKRPDSGPVARVGALELLRARATGRWWPRRRPRQRARPPSGGARGRAQPRTRRSVALGRPPRWHDRCEPRSRRLAMASSERHCRSGAQGLVKLRRPARPTYAPDRRPRGRRPRRRSLGPVVAVDRGARARAAAAVLPRRSVMLLVESASRSRARHQHSARTPRTRSIVLPLSADPAAGAVLGPRLARANRRAGPNGAALSGARRACSARAARCCSWCRLLDGLGASRRLAVAARGGARSGGCSRPRCSPARAPRGLAGALPRGRAARDCRRVGRAGGSLLLVPPAATRRATSLESGSAWSWALVAVSCSDGAVLGAAGSAPHRGAGWGVALDLLLGR